MSRDDLIRNLATQVLQMMPKARREDAIEFVAALSPEERRAVRKLRMFGARAVQKEQSNGHR